MMPTFAVFVPVGPDGDELDRVSDLLDSLVTYEPGVSQILMIDDFGWGRQLERRVRCPPTCQAAVLPNPRRGRGSGWAGGSCAGTLAALAWIHRHGGVDFVLRLDTDALVIAPFGQKIRDRFAMDAATGMLGSCYSYPDGRLRDDSHWEPSIKTFLSPAKLRGRYLQITRWGRPRRVRDALEAALGNGYTIAEHCQGGSYAISGEMLDRMANAGYLDDPLKWLRSGLTEDIMLGIYTRAVGLKPADFNRDRQPFGVQHVGLAYPPREFLARGYSIVHSIKDSPQQREAAIRAWFSRIRGAERVTS